MWSEPYHPYLLNASLWEMQLTSLSFARLVAALRLSKKTCTVVEQCCGGLVSSSIMAQPGASHVYYGGSIAYNTKRSKPLLLNNDALYQSLLTAARSDDAASLSEEYRYIQSKLDWTAQTSVAFCKEMDADFAIAEGALLNDGDCDLHLTRVLSFLTSKYLAIFYSRRGVGTNLSA